MVTPCQVVEAVEETLDVRWLTRERLEVVPEAGEADAVKGDAVHPVIIRTR